MGKNRCVRIPDLVSQRDRQPAAHSSSLDDISSVSVAAVLFSLSASTVHIPGLCVEQILSSKAVDYTNNLCANFSC